MATELYVLAIFIRQTHREYAVFKGLEQKIAISLYEANNGIDAIVTYKGEPRGVQKPIPDWSQSLNYVKRVLQEYAIFASHEQLAAVGINVMAPGGDFLTYRLIDTKCLSSLEANAESLPLLRTVMHDIVSAKEIFAGVPIYGISESAFFAHKPDAAWNYAIDLPFADRHEIKRFGYDGLTVESVVQILGKNRSLEQKLIVCCLDDVSSVAAVHRGKGIDTTMGYTPYEGVLSADGFGLLPGGLVKVKPDLRAGMAGISGTSGSIGEVLRLAQSKDYRAGLAMEMFVSSAQKGIGAMVAILGGVDQIVFTGFAGVNYPEIRQRVIAPFEYLGFAIDNRKNTQAVTEGPSCIQPRTRVKQVIVLKTVEIYEIAWRTRAALRIER